MTFITVFYGKILNRDELVKLIERNIICDILWDLIDTDVCVMKWFHDNILNENANINIDTPCEYKECINVIKKFLDNQDYYKCIDLKNKTYFVGIKLDEIFTDRITDLKLSTKTDDAFLIKYLNCEYNELRFYFKE